MGPKVYRICTSLCDRHSEGLYVPGGNLKWPNSYPPPLHWKALDYYEAFRRKTTIADPGHSDEMYRLYQISNQSLVPVG